MACGSFSTFELSTDLHGFANQADHKVDTPAPTWSGWVTAPAVLFYAGGSVNYRLPRVANAAAAHNVSYSVTSARPLRTGYTLNASTATITGSYASALARQNYTLRATDGFNRTADLVFTLEVSADAGIESIAITSNPGADKTYGKVAPFGTNDTITVRVDLTHRLTTVLGSRVCLNIRIGSNNRRECNPSHSTSDSSRWDKLDFSYAVQAGDWDGDGISFPTNPMGAGKDGGFRFRLTGVGTDNRVNRNFGPTPDDANHKVRGQQTVPSFGSTVTPYSWVRGTAISQVLPAATGGDGGVTYAIEGSLPAGLSFAAATRTISGTPTAAQGATNYTLVATDADGDSGRLTFSIAIEEIVVFISSPSATEGAAGATATLEYDVTLHRAPGRQVTVDWAAATNPGTATSGTDYTAITGGTLTFAASETSQTIDVTVTGGRAGRAGRDGADLAEPPSGAALGRRHRRGHDHRRRRDADALAGPVGSGCGESRHDRRERRRQRDDGDGEPERRDLGRGDHGDGDGDGRDRGGGRLQPVERQDADHRGRGDDEFGRGDGDGLGRRDGRAGRDRDGGRDGGRRARSGGGAFGPDLDHRRRRRPAALGPGAVSGLDLGVERRGDGDGDALEPLGRRGDGDGFGGAGGPGDGGRLRAVERDDADRRGGADDERGDRDGDGRRQRGRRAGQERDGLGVGVGDPRGGGPAGRDADDPRRRRHADGVAGAVVVVGLGVGRRGDGDGGAERHVERSGDGDGVGGGGNGRGGGRLFVVERGDTDDRGERHGEHGRGDDHGERQRGGFAGQGGDGLGHGDGGQRDRGAGEPDADAHRRRGDPDDAAGALVGVDRGGGRGFDGDGDALRRLERGDHDHGVGFAGRGDGFHADGGRR